MNCKLTILMTDLADIYEVIMKKNQRKTNQKISLKQNVLPFIFSPTYNGLRPGQSLGKPSRNEGTSGGRQILIEFVPDNFIDSNNSEVNILITPVIPK